MIILHLHKITCSPETEIQYVHIKILHNIFVYYESTYYILLLSIEERLSSEK